MTDEKRTADSIEAALREWANAPPRTPAAEAARQVRARVAAGRTRASRGAAWAWRLAAASAVAATVAAATLLWRAPGPSPPPPVAVDAPPVLPDNVVVFWLDAETPVYFVVGPPADPPGGTP